MGQHTWFSKSKELYLKELQLNEKMDSFEKEEIYLDNMELMQLNHEISEIHDNNRTEFHDLFRTFKRNDDRSYIEDVLFSRKECMEWIKQPSNLVSFKNTIFDTEEDEKRLRKQSMILLEKFWDKYPDGVIYFG